MLLQPGRLLAFVEAGHVLPLPDAGYSLALQGAGGMVPARSGCHVLLGCPVMPLGGGGGDHLDWLGKEYVRSAPSAWVHLVQWGQMGGAGVCTSFG